jgi:hypothetical protein
MSALLIQGGQYITLVGPGVFGVRLCGAGRMRTGSLWRVCPFPKTVCVACWTKHMDSLKARLAWLACLAWLRLVRLSWDFDGYFAGSLGV